MTVFVLIAIGALASRAVAQPAEEAEPELRLRVPDEPSPDTAQPALDADEPRVAARPEERPAPADANPNVEVLTRGPIHEAFAEPSTYEPKRSVVVPKQPAKPISEMPPEEKPDAQAQWIPGYWAWDDERKDFLWVSGLWRVSPPHKRWVPGYWINVEGGAKWVPGFWSPEEGEEVNYLPEPPRSIERGPNSPSPSEDHFWVPGYWVYRGGDYVWHAGYWTEIRPEWVWVPAHYVWTPTGYVFVGGYWDHPLARRGWLFAPVVFHEDVYLAPRYYYTPGVVLDTPAISVHLFARPAWGFYYFGDYYDAGYARVGYYPYHSYFSFGYDPIFTYDRWYYRHTPGWGAGLTINFNFYQHHPEARPARVYGNVTVNNTVINNTTIINKGGPQAAARPAMAMPLASAAAKPEVRNQVTKVPLAQRQAMVQENHNLSGARLASETHVAGTSKSSGPVSMKLPAAASVSSGGASSGGPAGISKAGANPALSSGARSAVAAGAVNQPKTGSNQPGRLSNGPVQTARSPGPAGGSSPGGSGAAGSAALKVPEPLDKPNSAGSSQGRSARATPGGVNSAGSAALKGSAPLDQPNNAAAAPGSGGGARAAAGGASPSRGAGPSGIGQASGQPPRASGPAMPGRPTAGAAPAGPRGGGDRSRGSGGKDDKQKHGPGR